MFTPGNSVNDKYKHAENTLKSFLQMDSTSLTNIKICFNSDVLYISGTIYAHPLGNICTHIYNVLKTINILLEFVLHILRWITL